MKTFIDDYFTEAVVEDSLKTDSGRDEEIAQTIRSIFRQIETSCKPQNILPA